MLSYNIELILRMLLACVCGIAVGIERNMRSKEAGIRTHCIVACASALMMIVSKYGFFDLIMSTNEFAADMRLDPSRMAQGIVTGVGFLGAGLIYLQRGMINGLTTAAGAWAVSGIGMAIGAGMYAIGISATVIVLIVQIILHTKHPFASRYKTKTLKIYDVGADDFQEFAEEKFKQLEIGIIDVSVGMNKEGTMDYSFCVELPKAMREEFLIKQFDYRCTVEFTH